MPYKNIKKQRKFARLWMRSKRAGKLWKGMEKIGTQRVKRKARMLPMRKKSTWLGKAPSHRNPPKRKSSF